MAIVDCICGHKTNTACSRYWLAQIDNKSKGCFARLNTRLQWERGCLYDQASKFDKKFADTIIEQNYDTSIADNLDKLHKECQPESNPDGAPPPKDFKTSMEYEQEKGE
jgi:hypothetical protein